MTSFSSAFASAFVLDPEVDHSTCRDSHSHSKALRVSPNNTFFILDWDDTLFPTSWLSRKGLSLESPFIPKQEREELERVDAIVSGFLRKLVFLYGQVLIITNAMQGWVELSSRKFLPDTYELLFQTSDTNSQHSFSSSSTSLPNEEQNPHPSHTHLNIHKPSHTSPLYADSTSISVISARFLFERDFPTNPSQWKLNAFRQVLKARIPLHFQSITNAPESADQEVEVDAMECEDLDSELALVELEEEFETEFCENDSFFSVDFSTDFDYDYPAVGGGGGGGKLEVEFVGVGGEKEDKEEGCSVLSIGDCRHDCSSVREMALELRESVSRKSVKLKNQPSVREVVRQLEEIETNIQELLNVPNDLHLLLRISN